MRTAITVLSVWSIGEEFRRRNQANSHSEGGHRSASLHHLTQFRPQSGFMAVQVNSTCRDFSTTNLTALAVSGLLDS